MDSLGRLEPVGQQEEQSDMGQGVGGLESMGSRETEDREGVMGCPLSPSLYKTESRVHRESCCRTCRGRRRRSGQGALPDLCPAVTLARPLG